MNPRQRFLATMHYQPRDRSPICDFSFWDETLEAWYEKGLPRDVNRASSKPDRRRMPEDVSYEPPRKLNGMVRSGRVI